MSELIKMQYAKTRQNLTKVLEDVSPEVLERIPAGFNNNIHWQVGHILVAAELFMFYGQNNLPPQYNEYFKSGSKPAEWAGEVPSISSILELLNEQLERINALPEEAFTVELPEPFIGNKNTGELAAFGAFHEALHLGQIQMLKRFILASEAAQ
ncbi:DinB family protein [Lysinibacillus yapensis]|uniref:DinB family protein n=1 Tax=Ureibacillus yapensis TaxID=2304605 RepID=A0A396SA11_9BACL|nr:DinB family protein [Lysinibacillus yapensis]RHW37621.1 DinB family protein [Lysinibacillus yapensis]